MANGNDASLLFEAPAPWSPVARDDIVQGEQSIRGLAASLAQSRLAAEIKRYARGQVSGRSFLVAGHRGAGKTTSVLAAMQEVYNECREGRDSMLARCRPLFVRLHAPSLLVDTLNGGDTPKQKRAAGSGADEGADAETEAADAANGEMGSEAAVSVETRRSTRFLQEMAAGIFPALVDEVRRLLLGQVDIGTRGTDGRVDTLRLSNRQIHNREVIAHVSDELSRGVTLAELRELFRRLRLLPQGLLGNVDAYQELVTIQAASEAYLIVTGKFEEQQNSARGATQKDASKVEQAFSGEKFVKSLTPAAAAAAAAYGVSKDNPAAGIIVALGVLLSGLTFSWSSARERSRSAAATRTFKRDTSHESLIRRVPLLVERLREVGFPVVFVVDELDKLERGTTAEDLMRSLMRDLKSYVTERSFLCFVVERAYYESVFRIRPEQPDTSPTGAYGVAHTFYSDAAFVVLTHAALHAYLRVALCETRPDDSAQRTDGHDEAARQLHLAKFRCVLMSRSRVHAYDLRRELARARAGGDLAAIARGGAFRAPVVWAYAALLELSIEWVMCEERRSQRAAEDPYFAQVEQDLLYDIAAAWRSETAARVDQLSIEIRVKERTAVRGDHPLLVGAVQELVEILSAPQSLPTRVDDDLDMQRVKRFLLDGEEEPSVEEVKNAEIRKLAGRDPSLLKRCFATRKYRVLRNVTGAFALPMLKAGSGEWLVDSRGDSDGYAELGPGNKQRVLELLEFKNSIAELKLAENFPTVWADAAGPSFPFTQLESALVEYESRPGDPNVKSDIARFAEIAPEVCRLISILLAGKSLLETAHPTAAGARVHDVLIRAIQGTSITIRASSAAKLVRKLAERYGATLTVRMNVILREGDADQQVLDEARALRPEDVPSASNLVHAEATQAEWRASLFERMFLALANTAVDDIVEDQGRLLDLIADLNEWFPPALRQIWTTLPRPQEWTIKMCSALVGEDRPGLELVSAFAAIRLGLGFEANLALAAASRQASPRSQLHEWLTNQLSAIPESPPRLLLVNSGDVMSRWLPEPGLSIVSIAVPDMSHLERVLLLRQRRLADFDVVLYEGDRPPPPHVDTQVCAAILPAPPTRGVERWQRRTEGTRVLLGPTSLREALEWLAEAA
jgi:hypothetical protein